MNRENLAFAALGEKPNKRTLAQKLVDLDEAINKIKDELYNWKQKRCKYVIYDDIENYARSIREIEGQLKEMSFLEKHLSERKTYKRLLTELDRLKYEINLARFFVKDKSTMDQEMLAERDTAQQQIEELVRQKQEIEGIQAEITAKLKGLAIS